MEKKPPQHWLSPFKTHPELGTLLVSEPESSSKYFSDTVMLHHVETPGRQGRGTDALLVIASERSAISVHVFILLVVRTSVHVFTGGLLELQRTREVNTCFKEEQGRKNHRHHLLIT